MSPKLKSLLARITLVGGVALVTTQLARNAPHDQTIAVRLPSRDVTHVEGVITKAGDDEPTAGFSQDFAGGSPRLVRHTFSAVSGTYIVVITLRERVEAAAATAPATNQAATPPTNQERMPAPSAVRTDEAAAPPANQERVPTPSGAGEANPIPHETSFQRQVSLAGGEVIVSPD